MGGLAFPWVTKVLVCTIGLQILFFIVLKMGWNWSMFLNWTISLGCFFNEGYDGVREYHLRCCSFGSFCQQLGGFMSFCAWIFHAWAVELLCLIVICGCNMVLVPSWIGWDILPVSFAVSYDRMVEQLVQSVKLGEVINHIDTILECFVSMGQHCLKFLHVTWVFVVIVAIVAVIMCCFHLVVFLQYCFHLVVSVQYCIGLTFKCFKDSSKVLSASLMSLLIHPIQGPHKCCHHVDDCR